MKSEVKGTATSKRLGNTDVEIPIIISPSTAALSHRKAAFSGICRTAVSLREMTKGTSSNLIITCRLTSVLPL